MLAILSAILGFAGPFIPELLKLFRQKQDNAHELAVKAVKVKGYHDYAGIDNNWVNVIVFS